MEPNNRRRPSPCRIHADSSALSALPNRTLRTAGQPLREGEESARVAACSRHPARRGQLDTLLPEWTREVPQTTNTPSRWSSLSGEIIWSGRPAAVRSRMPTNRSASLRRQFRPRKDGEARKRSATHAAALVAADALIVNAHKRELLSIAIWKYTEAEGGKWRCRYRSSGVLSEVVSPIEHEHVWPRKWLIDRMLNRPERVPEIMASAVACLVTAEEHRRLGAVAPHLVGWERYGAAGIVVYDMSADPITRLLLDGGRATHHNEPRVQGLAAEPSVPITNNASWGDPAFAVTGLCHRCTRMYDDPLFTCEAFPGGIPDEILFGGFDHHRPYPGDDGIRFVQIGDPNAPAD